MTAQVKVSRVVLDAGLLADFGRDMGDLGKVGGQCLNVILGESNKVSGLLSAGLHGSAARDYDDELGPEIGEDVGAGPAKAIPIREQHDDGGDAPRHAQHGERGAAAIVPHGAVGFLEQIMKHIGSLGATLWISLLPQGLYRLQHGGLARGIKTGDHSRHRQAANRQQG